MKVSLVLVLIFLSLQTFAQKKYEISMPIMPKNLLPTKQWYYYHYFISKYLFRNLVSVDNKGLLRGDIAKRWTISKDGRKYTFQLKKDVVYQGYHITAHDIEYSFKQYFDKSNKSSIKSYLMNAFRLEGKDLSKQNYGELVQVNDDYSITFNLKKPYAPFLYVLSLPTFGIIPKITSKTDYTFLKDGTVPGKFARNVVLKFNNDKLSIVSKDKEIAISKGKNLLGYDVAMGISEKEVNLLRDHGYSVISLNGLAINHLYFNCADEFSLALKQRTFLKKIFQESFKKVEDTSLISSQTTFLPNGIMPRPYYLTSLEKSVEKVKIDKKIRIILRVEHFPVKVIERLKKNLSEYQIKFDIILIEGKDYVKNLQERKYHLISGASVGVFPDPDGFLSILEESNRYKFLNCNTSNLMDSLSKHRNSNNVVDRLKGYSESFSSFESENKIIQAFSIKPIIVMKSKRKLSRFSYKFIPSLGDVIDEN
ncbi:ABC transporter substrate-binding protein [Halobacteriovorax sp. JY17]|uniref:ABC transporter substrate-binding protein n=1 Tax=Halobacteriovorax sp. JY17 TaxID=2014617 RepID=UPI000C6B864B|nr:ABC transporter substrate-binding protein [Halobacteriovorax sp. JY17]PIK14061.1 MAG: hypothetical protein CES88_13845 [Halobacteriovorax sp. JY17]